MRLPEVAFALAMFASGLAVSAGLSALWGPADVLATAVFALAAACGFAVAALPERSDR